MRAAAVDPDAARAFLDVFSCLELPGEVLDRPGMREKVKSLAASSEPLVPPGPTREQLIALAQ
jgi:hypothetical protein